MEGVTEYIVKSWDVKVTFSNGDLFIMVTLQLLNDI